MQKMQEQFSAAMTMVFALVSAIRFRERGFNISNYCSLTPFSVNPINTAPKVSGPALKDLFACIFCVAFNFLQNPKGIDPQDDNLSTRFELLHQLTHRI